MAIIICYGLNEWRALLAHLHPERVQRREAVGPQAPVQGNELGATELGMRHRDYGALQTTLPSASNS